MTDATAPSTTLTDEDHRWADHATERLHDARLSITEALDGIALMDHAGARDDMRAALNAAYDTVVSALSAIPSRYPA